ncbi:MAG: tRNA (adenosine(37)-N6)-threonylcarbamoyltransferase complex dimerization subunit type 1 TsaB [bacterium]|nr:MAG: tRNA (adenosine(37)-N6)-threonylcarbamoyltransferase complex dimerization subunit type 1 TsaB [bacterium]
MVILAADTSTALCSVAVRNKEGDVVLERSLGNAPHSEILLPMVDKVLSTAKLTRNEVQTMAMGTGPGTFTGLRVGLATFKGWAAATGLPVVPVNSLDAVALPALQKGLRVLVLADARKGEVYGACYAGLDGDGLPKMEGEIALIGHDHVADWARGRTGAGFVALGTGVPLLMAKGLGEGLRIHSDFDPFPCASRILTIAEVHVSLGRVADLTKLRPVYVRPPDARPQSPGRSILSVPGEDHDPQGP